GEPVAAARAARRLHRVAQLAQALQVAAEGAGRGADPAGQLRPVPDAAVLEQREEFQDAGARSVHGPPMLRRIAARIRPQPCLASVACPTTRSASPAPASTTSGASTSP